MSLAMPPLPPNWSEHKAPNGTAYYYNNLTKQSTYTRPLPSGVAPSFPPPSIPQTIPQSVVAAPPKKKEKPKEKIPIPGTNWTKVITSENNVFYAEKGTKKSSWTVPEEIKEAVEAYEADLKTQAIRKEEELRLKKEDDRQAEIKERERIRLELEEERINKIEAEKKRKRELDKERERKRKEREGEDDEQEQGDEDRPSKMAKVNGVEKTASEVDEDEEQAAMGPVDEDDEAAWQAAVAAEIAKENKEKDKQKKEMKAAKKAEEEQAKAMVFHAPAAVELNPDEGKALFKSLLFEKNISPFAPWESSLPLFINDPRYVLLPSQKLREEVYEEYCREAARAKRLGKNVTANATASSSSPPPTSSATKDPEKEYKSLLRAEVKSTRTSWDDFKRSWKKDRRFFDFGKDDRQREKTFREHLRELGERKRADAKRAERDFLEMLEEHSEVTVDSEWTKVKRSMVSDARYDAVGSSSLRAELFQQHVTCLRDKHSAPETKEQVAERRARERKERAEASVRERQQQVQVDKRRLEHDMQRSRQGAGKEDGEREFGSLLVQAVREHNVYWKDVIPQLEKDPRWNHPSLTLGDKHNLFNEHLQSLAHKRLDALHKVFLAHSPALDTPFEDVYPEVVDDFAIKRLDLSPEKLETRYKEWQAVRFQQSKKDFETLLKESSFVDFWGRLKNKGMADEGVIPGEEDEEDDDGDEAAGGRANLAAMAQQVDLKGMHDVLQNDKRYLLFDYIPEQREQWLRDYLAGLDNSLANVHTNVPQ